MLERAVALIPLSERSSLPCTPGPSTTVPRESPLPLGPPPPRPRRRGGVACRALGATSTLRDADTLRRLCERILAELGLRAVGLGSGTSSPAPAASPDCTCSAVAPRLHLSRTPARHVQPLLLPTAAPVDVGPGSARPRGRGCHRPGGSPRRPRSGAARERASRHPGLRRPVVYEIGSSMVAVCPQSAARRRPRRPVGREPSAGWPNCWSGRGRPPGRDGRPGRRREVPTHRPDATRPRGRWGLGRGGTRRSPTAAGAGSPRRRANTTSCSSCLGPVTACPSTPPSTPAGR